MMTRTWVHTVRLLCLLTALPAIASAQERPLRIAFGGGASFPSGHIAEEGEMGYNLQASLRLALAGGPVGLRADGIYQSIPDEHGGSFTGLGGLAGLAVSGTGSVRPYGFAGVGALKHEAPDEEHGDHTHEGERGTSFAYQVGAGLGFDLGGVGAFAEVRWLDGGEDHRAIPITVGLSF
ncbi:MAG: porin family protein [Gemmatimonadetes bacterium]|nr:porin family protein [Gemmatimonadota bacterium]